MGNLIAFAYYGGKYKHLKDILPLLPPADHYCEPFCGSAVVLLNRQPSPIETINDLNGDITNFFEVLRTQPEKLIGQLELTPYSRREFEQAWFPSDDLVERARRFFIRVRMDIAKAGAKKDKSFALNATYEKNQFSYAPRNLITKVAGLEEVAQRLRNVQIENRPAVDIIKRFDQKTTLIYGDPPYLAETRTSSNDYAHEMNLEQHQELAQVLNECKGKVALSGYDAPRMNELYPTEKWFKTGFKKRRVPMSRSGKLKRQEVLWTNYDPKQLYGQSTLFSL